MKLSPTLSVLLTAGITYVGARGVAALARTASDVTSLRLDNPLSGWLGPERFEFSAFSDSTLTAMAAGAAMIVGHFLISHDRLRMGLYAGAAIAAIQAFRGHPIEAPPEWAGSNQVRVTGTNRISSWTLGRPA